MEQQVFESTVAKNSQVTVRKKIRDLLGIEAGDVIFLQVVRVLSPEGKEKYAFEKDHEDDMETDE